MLLNAKEAAERLRISLSLLYSLVEDGRLPAVRLGRKGKRGCVRIREEDLERLLESAKGE